MSASNLVDLNDALRRKALVLFIGADLSRDVTGLPSRRELTEGLARRYGIDVPRGHSLAEVAQRVGRAGSRFEFTQFICDAVGNVPTSPQAFHRRVVDWVDEHRITTLITTRYDNLLERAFQEASAPLDVVRGGDLAFASHTRPLLIKLYGDCQRVDRLVITDSDHSALLRDSDRQDLIEEVRRALRRNTLYMLGYDLSDPDFRFLFDGIAASEFSRRAYAVWTGMPSIDVEMWRDRGIIVLDSDPFGLLDARQEADVAGTDLEGEGVDRKRSGRRDLDTAVVRELLTAALSDGELTALCFDHFRPVYDNLSSTMSKGQKIQHLIEYCVRQGQIEHLVAEIESVNPAQYAYYAPRLDRGADTDRGVGRSGSQKGTGDASMSAEGKLGTGNRWAVLVGVDEYDDWANYGTLQVCVRDVERVRERLVAGGFEEARIRLITDHTDVLPTRANILVALKAVADNTSPEDLLLFYYSGHGDQEGRESFLVGRDGRRLVLSDTAISLDRVKQILEEAPARAKVIVLDACHSGADIGGKGPKPMSEGFIRRVFEQAEGMAILASCKQGQLSYEWRENEQSVFTHFLLEAMQGLADQDEKGFVTVQDASRYVSDGVKLWASQHDTVQTPTLQYTVSGDIKLVDWDQRANQ